MRKIENADVEEITNDTKCGQIGKDATNFFEQQGNPNQARRRAPQKQVLLPH